MKTFLRFALAVGLLAMAAVACYYSFSRSQRTESHSTRYPVEGIDSLSVDCPNGKVRIEGAAGLKEVTVETVTKVTTRNAAETSACMNAVEIFAHTKNRTLELGWRWREKPKRTWSASVDFDIKIPAAWMVSAHVGNGQLNVSHVAADVKANTGNGIVKVADIRGRLMVSVGNGAIHAKQVVGDLDLETGNGEIDVEGQPAKVRLLTGNGAIRADWTSATVVNGKVSTDNGAITLHFGSRSSVLVDCETGNGRIDMAPSVKRVKKPDGGAVGHMGAGEGALSVRTGNGAIEIEHEAPLKAEAE